MRKQKPDYKSKKIIVCCNQALKTDIEISAKNLGISEGGLLRMLFKKYQKEGKLTETDLISEV